MAETISFNGELIAAGAISISHDAMGFAYGYGVFETIKIREGELCFFREHYDRLSASCNALGLKELDGFDTLRKRAKAVVDANSAMESGLKIICFRGKTGTEIVILLRDPGGLPAKGASLRLSPFVQSSQAITVKHKTMNYLENLLQLRSAQEAGFEECIFLNEYECLTECCTANLFFASEGKLRTPSIDCGILGGVIRERVIQLAEQGGILVEEGRYSIEEIEYASEVFITNSLSGIVSVDRIQLSGTVMSSYEGTMFQSLKRELSQSEMESFR